METQPLLSAVCISVGAEEGPRDVGVGVVCHVVLLSWREQTLGTLSVAVGAGIGSTV